MRSGGSWSGKVKRSARPSCHASQAAPPAPDRALLVLDMTLDRFRGPLAIDGAGAAIERPT